MMTAPHGFSLSAAFLILAAIFADVKMTGEPIDISDQFDFSQVRKFGFQADDDQPFSIDEDKVSLAITAAAVDPDDNHLPTGPPTEPIFQTYE
jgi:hypothetical protein